MASNEQLLISSVLRNSDMGTALKQGIKGNMFYVYPEIWEWMEHYYMERSRTPSKEVFRTKFGASKFDIKVIDDTEFLSGEVKQDHKEKSAYNAVQQFLDLLEQKDADGALEAMAKSSVRINAELGLINDGDIFTDHDDIMAEFLLRKERFEKYGAAGVPTGFPTFDDRTGGFAPGEFHVFAARPGNSKSWNLQKFAAHAALQGSTVQFNALEQPRANVMARIVSLVSKDIGGEIYSSQNLIRGSGYDALRFQKFLNNLKNEVKGKLHVADGTKGKVTTSAIAAQIERNKPDIVFVDHITLMGRPTKDFSGVAEVADDLTQLANQYSIPVVSAAQLNRGGAQDGADLDTIAEADKIGQNASGVVFIKQLSPHCIAYQNKKARYGEGGFSWFAEFRPDRGIFNEVTQAQAKEIIYEDNQESEDD